jgi:multiple sugar transport system permease protein
MASSVQASATTRQPQRSMQQQRHLSDRAIRNLFIFPTLILLILMNVFPLFYSLYLSFTDYSAIARQAPVWVGLDNYVPRSSTASSSGPTSTPRANTRSFP